jgi:hypothetical protein
MRKYTKYFDFKISTFSYANENNTKASKNENSSLVSIEQYTSNRLPFIAYRHLFIFQNVWYKKSRNEGCTMKNVYKLLTRKGSLNGFFLEGRERAKWTMVNPFVHSRKRQKHRH